MTKKRTALLMLIITLVCFGLGIILFSPARLEVNHIETSSQPPHVKPAPLPEVIVALQPIARGAPFVSGSIGRRKWPNPDSLPPNIIVDEVETIGKVAQVDIVQGQVIVRHQLTDPGQAGEASLQLPPPAKSDITKVNYLNQTQNQQLAIIYTGLIRLVVEDTEQMVETITTLVESKGGYVSASYMFLLADTYQGRITIRVPSTEYQTTLSELRALAVRVEHEESESEDVSEEFVDLEARRANLEAGEAALLALMNKRLADGEVKEIVDVQSELTEIRGDIEKTAGRLRYLTNQITFSTIMIELDPDIPPTPTLTPTATPVPTPIPRWQPQGTAKEATQSLLFSLQQTVDLMIWMVIYWLPLSLLWLIPLLVVLWGIRWVWRRYNLPLPAWWSKQ